MDSEEGMTDLERLQSKANAVTDGSLESTRRMMAMMEDVSIQTIVKHKNMDDDDDLVRVKQLEQEHLTCLTVKESS